MNPETETAQTEALAGKRIFITGGTGFVGKHLVQTLNDGNNELLLLTRNNYHKDKLTNVAYLYGDLSSPNTWQDSLQAFNPDSCIHLAWEGIPDYGIKHTIKNITSSLFLFDILGRIGCKNVLSAGTLWEYGSHLGKLSEDMNVIPEYSIALSKHVTQLIGKDFSRKYNYRFSWARLFYVYGPGQREGSLIPNLVKAALSNEDSPIRNPNSRNDFIYVEDVAQALKKIIICPGSFGIYNIGSGKLTNIHYIAELVYRQLGVILTQPKIVVKGSTDSFTDSYADISKIRAEIGWEPKTSIEDGVDKTVDFFSIKYSLTK